MLKGLLRSISVVLILSLGASNFAYTPISAHETSPDVAPAEANTVMVSQASDFGTLTDGRYRLTDDTVYVLQ